MNIAIRVAVIGIGAQFGTAGLGMTIVCLIRKEKFSNFGLNTKKLLPALILSLACCVPDYIYCFYRGWVHAWCPFYDVNTTPDAFLEMLVTMILIYGMLIVRKETGNALGGVLIFFVYWNAL